MRMEDRVPQELLTADLHELGDSAAILRLSGEIDISSAHKLTDQFELAAKRGYSELVIDATEVTFLDSSGLHALVEGKRLIHQNGSKIALVPSNQVRRVIELVFPGHLYATRVDTIDEAIEALGLDEGTDRAGIES